MNEPLKVLYLYAGVGGNRKLWNNVEVVAVENDPKIAAVYQKLYPQDDVFVEDAHQFLLEAHEFLILCGVVLLANHIVEW